MDGLLTIYRKEMRAYFVSPIPYIVIMLFSAGRAWHFFDQAQFFLVNKASLAGGLFYELEYTLIVLAPLIGMRVWSEEERTGTIETLMTSPISTTAMGLGKYFAAWTVLSLCLLSPIGLALTAASLGDLDWGAVIGGYFGACLLCGALLAVSTWISSYTQHQLVAFVVSFFIGALFVGVQFWADKEGGSFGAVLEDVSMTARYQAMGRGVIDLRDLVYFASAITFFLYCNVQAIENRRVR